MQTGSPAARLSIAECLRLVRAPSFVVPIVLFPLLYYASSGLAPGGHHPAIHPDSARHMLSTYVAFGCVAPGLLGIGIAAALDRAVPPLGIYFAAKLVTAVLVAAAVSAVLTVLGAVLGKVVLELAQWAGMLILSVLGGLREVR